MAKRIKWKPYWIVVTTTGTAFLNTASETKAGSIRTYLRTAGNGKDWRWWRRSGGVSCEHVEITIRNI